MRQSSRFIRARRASPRSQLGVQKSPSQRLPSIEGRAPGITSVVLGKTASITILDGNNMNRDNNNGNINQNGRVLSSVLSSSVSRPPHASLSPWLSSSLDIGLFGGYGKTVKLFVQRTGRRRPIGRSQYTEKVLSSLHRRSPHHFAALESPRRTWRALRHGCNRGISGNSYQFMVKEHFPSPTTWRNRRLPGGHSAPLSVGFHQMRTMLWERSANAGEARQGKPHRTRLRVRLRSGAPPEKNLLETVNHEPVGELGECGLEMSSERECRIGGC